MKLRTRVIAWLHIIGDIPAALMVLALILVGGSTLTGRAESEGANSLLDKLTSESMVLVLVSAGTLLLLADVVPWICLLKKRRWAWWYLTVLYALGTVSILFFWVPLPKSQAAVGHAILSTVAILISFGITLIFLLTDIPGRRKTSTRRKRRSTPRRGYYTRRRRRTYYDY